MPAEPIRKWVSVSEVKPRASIPTLADLLPSWRRHLRAENKSAKTLASYLESAQQLADYLDATGMPVAVASIRREHVDGWIEDLLDRRSAATAAVRYRSVQQFFRWAAGEG